MVGNRAFTQEQGVYAQSALCLDANTGQTIWQRRYDWPYDAEGMYPGPRSTPTWYQGRLYYADPQGQVGCLDAEDGGPVWSLNVIEQFDGRGHDFGYSCSPLVEEGLVILPVGGKGASVVALDADTGSTVWASGDGPASYCSAMPISFRGRRCVVVFMRNSLVLLELRTGRLLWEKRWSQGYDEHSTFPLYQEPFLMVACPFRGGAEMYRLEAGSNDSLPVDVSRAWSSKELSNDIISSVLIDGFVYGFDIRDIQAKANRPSKGRYKCIDLATGKALWASDRPGHASAVAADGKLLLFNDSGEIVLAAANPDKYEELGRVKIFQDEICWTAPSLSAGRLFLRSPTRAVCVLVAVPPPGMLQPVSTLPVASTIGPSRSINWNRLLGGERECPFDPPDIKELWSWYAFSILGAFLPAGLAALVVYGICRRYRRNFAGVVGETVFWAACLVLGFVVTPVGNRVLPTFTFTWPVCLFAAQQITLTAVWHRKTLAQNSPMRLASLCAGLVFVAICLGYFHACRKLGMALQWCFLLGFMPSWPLAIPAARSIARGPRLLRDILLAVVAFTIFYWASGGYILWRRH